LNTTNVFKKNFEQIKNGKKIIINEGGSRSSKTFSILQSFVFLMSLKNFKNKTFSVVAESLPHLKRGAMKDFFEILKTDDLYDMKFHNMTDHKYVIETNAIEFFGVDDYTKVTGAGRDFLFINEANNISWQIYQQLQLRTRTLTFIDYNPTHSFWVHEHLLKQDNVGYVHSTYLDNPYVSQNTIDILNRSKDTDPNFYNVYALGKIGSNEGLVFNNWNIIDQFPESDKVVYGLDFGFMDPSCCVSIFKIGDELYVDEIFYSAGMTNLDISEQLINMKLKKGYDEIYADSAEPKSIDELHRRGWNIKPTLKGPDSIIKGIDLMKQYKINVSKRSVNLIKELRQYQWIKDKDGKLTNKPGGPDHLIDSVRYALMSSEKRNIGGFSFV
jgi:phage terminase large subunit